jgi:hypothetical protein
MGTSFCWVGVFILTLHFATVAAETGDAKGAAHILKWADRHGIDRSAVEVKTFPRKGSALRLRGLGAARDIKKGEIVLAVGGLLSLTSWSMPSVRACRGLWDEWQGGHQRLVLLLLLEKSLGKASAFYEYIQSLPTYEDYVSFYPYAAKQAAAEFIALPIIASHKSWRKDLRRLWNSTATFRQEKKEERGLLRFGDSFDRRVLLGGVRGFHA